MSETVDEKIVAVAEEAKAPGKFSLTATLKQDPTSYPEKSETIYLNAKDAGEAIFVGDEIADKKAEKAKLEELAKKAAGAGSIVGDPETEEALEKVNAEIEALEAKQLELLERVKASALTFKMRGVPPKLWRAIDANWVAKIKAESKSPEDQEAAMMLRNDKVNYETIAKSIVSISNADGDVDDSPVSIETVEDLHGKLLMSEWQKLKDLSDILTFGNGYFQRIAEEDADFLPKP